jgi:hypothetical protein
MSFVHQTDVYRNLGKAESKRHGYGLILALFCMALAIVVSSAILAPTPIGSGINSEPWFVGP